MTNEGLTVCQLHALVGSKVKVKPNGRAKKKKNGLMICTLKAIQGSRAFVVPSGHRREEECSIDDIVYWAKGFHMNETQFEKYAHLFHDKEEGVGEIKSTKPITVKEPIVPSTKIRSAKLDDRFVISNVRGEIFWNKDGYFVTDLNKASVYTNPRGLKVALSLIGKRYKKTSGADKWKHITDTTPLMALSFEEASILQSTCTFPEEALMNPFYEGDLFCKEVNSPSIEESLSVEAPTPKQEKYIDLEDLKRPIVYKPTSPEISSQSTLYDKLNEVITARQAVLTAEIALREAQIQLSKNEAEYDQLLLKEKLERT